MTDFFSNNGTNGTQASGAYIFQPTGPASNFPGTMDLTIIDGPYVKEAWQVYGASTSHILRLYQGSEMMRIIEVVHNVAQLQGNTELVTRFETSVGNNGMLYRFFALVFQSCLRFVLY